MPLGCDVPLRRGGRPFARTPRDLVGREAHIAPQRKALSFRASACREASALGVHTGVGIHTSPTHFPRCLPTNHKSAPRRGALETVEKACHCEPVRAAKQVPLGYTLAWQSVSKTRKFCVFRRFLSKKIRIPTSLRSSE